MELKKKAPTYAALVAWNQEEGIVLIDQDSLREMCGGGPPWLIYQVSCSLCGCKAMAVSDTSPLDLKDGSCVCPDCNMPEAKVEGL